MLRFENSLIHLGEIAFIDDDGNSIVFRLQKIEYGTHATFNIIGTCTEGQAKTIVYESYSENSTLTKFSNIEFWFGEGLGRVSTNKDMKKEDIDKQFKNNQIPFFELRLLGKQSLILLLIVLPFLGSLFIKSNITIWLISSILICIYIVGIIITNRILWFKKKNNLKGN